MSVTFEDLEAALQEVQENIKIEKQRGAEKDTEQIAKWEQEEAKILAQMDELSKQEVTAQVGQAHEERVRASVSSIADDLRTLTAGGFPIATMFAGEREAEISQIAIQRLMEDRESALLDQLKGLEEQLLQEQRQNTYLQGRIKDADSRADQLAAEANQLRTDLADAEQKRDAAARELSDAQSKIEQLQSWNDDLHKQIAVGTRGAQRVIDPEEKARIEAEEKAAAERLRIEKYTVYDVKPDNDLNPRKYYAKRAFDNEPVEFLAFARKAYTILNDENEVQQFRTEHQPEPMAPNNADVAEPAEPVQTADNVGEQFQGEEDPSPAQPDVVPPPSPVSEGTGTNDSADAVSREEFDQLKKAVDVAYIRLSAIEEHVMSRGVA